MFPHFPLKSIQLKVHTEEQQPIEVGCVLMPY